MVLKKPFAFIIRHFRAIHLVLLLPMLYLLYKTGNIVSFFRDYVSNGYMVGSNLVLSELASTFVNAYMYIAVIFILVVLIFLSLVLQNKNKPTKLYNMATLYYLILFGLITGSFVIFGMIENDTLDDTVARILRDFSLLVYLSQFIFMAYMVIRGVGFNIKQFNFKDDLEDLQISAEDSEEFEFLVGRDTYKTKRNIRRFFRELKYYYKENKFIFTIIFVIIIGILANGIFMNGRVVQKVYKKGENTAFGFINVKIDDSYISNLDLNGNVINKDKTYVIVKLELSNRYREDKIFNYANMQLVVNRERISPNIIASNYFSDLGNPYNGGLIKGNTDSTYLLVYEMDKDLVHGGKYQIEAYSGTNGEAGTLAKRFRINPTIISSDIKTKNVNKGTLIDLSSTELKKSKLSLIDYELTGRFTYTYTYCSNSTNCYDSLNDISLGTNEVGKLTIMAIDYNLILDTESIYFSYSNKNYKNFFNDFLTINYTLNGVKYSNKVDVLNPTNYADKLIFKINNNISNADSIEGVLTIRNKSFIIKLK